MNAYHLFARVIQIFWTSTWKSYDYPIAIEEILKDMSTMECYQTTTKKNKQTTKHV